MKDDYTTNSHYTSLVHLSLKGWESVLFELGSERVKARLGEPRISEILHLDLLIQQPARVKHRKTRIGRCVV